jgi:hypothetical protein
MQDVKGDAVISYCEPLTIRQRRTSAADAVSSAFPQGKQLGKYQIRGGFYHMCIHPRRPEIHNTLYDIGFITFLPCC